MQGDQRISKSKYFTINLSNSVPSIPSRICSTCDEYYQPRQMNKRLFSRCMRLTAIHTHDQTKEWSNSGKSKSRVRITWYSCWQHGSKEWDRRNLRRHHSYVFGVVQWNLLVSCARLRFFRARARVSSISKHVHIFPANRCIQSIPLWVPPDVHA